jgi:hypothetical protein
MPHTYARYSLIVLLALGSLLLGACAAALQPANVTSVTVEARDDGYVAVIRGEHPDACAQLGASTQTAGEDGIQIALLQTPADPNTMCAQVITPFTVEKPLDVSGLPEGTYTVTVNDVRAELTVGAQPAASPAAQPAWVTSVELAQRDGKYVLIVSGDLPDPCHEIGAVTPRVEANAITVDVQVNPPAPDVLCAQVITPYTVEVPLDETLAPGQYTVTVNDYAATLTVP